MNIRRGMACLLAGLVVLPASADIWEDVYRGLQIATIPVAQRGGERFGRVGILPNRLGDGYRLEFDRNFGLNNLGRPEVYDLGNLELELRGSIQGTFGFTRRGIPTANGDLTATNLTYALRGKTGAQDLTLEGTLNLNQQIEVNPLGFYTVDIDVNNTASRLLADGVAVDGDLDTDWDFGPISIRGNIYFDAVVGLLNGLGVDTSRVEQIFPDSPISVINSRISDLLNRDGDVLGELALNDSARVSDAALFADADTFFSALADDLDAAQVDQPIAVPEPSAIVLLAMGAAALVRRR